MSDVMGFSCIWHFLHAGEHAAGIGSALVSFDCTMIMAEACVSIEGHAAHVRCTWWPSVGKGGMSWCMRLQL